jgi:hypothetical protein
MTLLASWTVGAVQTAYANGASTYFLKNELGLAVRSFQLELSIYMLPLITLILEFILRPMVTALCYITPKKWLSLKIF